MLPARESELDPRFAQLPELIRCATGPALTVADVRRFSELLLKADGEMFAGTLLFYSRDGRGFVLVGEVGASGNAPREWSRWPLRRLFVGRRPCVITRSFDCARALAVPLKLSAGGYYAVVAPIEIPRLEFAQMTFLEILESLFIGMDDRNESFRTSTDRIGIQYSAAAPVIAWFGGKNALYQEVLRVSVAHGWQLDIAPTLGHVVKRLEQRDLDVLVIDGTALRYGIETLRMLQRASRSFVVPVLYVNGRDTTSELKALVDDCIATPLVLEDVFKSLKRLVSIAPSRRADGLRSSVEEFSASFRTCKNSAALAQEIAVAAIAIGAEWASVSIVDQLGAVYNAEEPRGTIRLMQGLPSTFLSGDTVMRSPVEADFFNEVIDDSRTRQRLETLAPRSAIALPLAESGRIIGTMLAFSITRLMSEAHYQAMLDLGRLASHCCSELHAQIVRERAFNERAALSLGVTSLASRRQAR
jgi:hypothetical protein